MNFVHAGPDDENAIRARLAADIRSLQDAAYGYTQAGAPRFRAMFGRDSCIVSWQLIDYDPAIAYRSIKILSTLQGKSVDKAREEEPGKIVHEWHQNPPAYKPLPWPLPYYGSVDATPLFIFLCGLYYQKTKDAEWLTTSWPHVAAALSWCENFGNAGGDALLAYERKNPGGLTHQGWKDSRMDGGALTPPIKVIEAQGYYFIALRAAAGLARARNEEAFADRLEKRSLAVQKQCIEQFWDPVERFFTSMRSQSGARDPRVMSNPGHLLFTGILDDEEGKRDAVVERLFYDDMWTPFGIRTHAQSNKDFSATSYHLGSVWPHDNWIIAQGMKKYGYHAEYQKVKAALLSAYTALRAIPELYAVVDGTIEAIAEANVPQAWASGALLQMLSDA